MPTLEPPPLPFRVSPLQEHSGARHEQAADAAAAAAAAVSSLAENRRAASQAQAVWYVHVGPFPPLPRIFRDQTRLRDARDRTDGGAASLPGARVYPPAVALPRTTSLRERWFVVVAGGGWLMARARFNASRASVTQKIELHTPRAPFFSSLLYYILFFSLPSVSFLHVFAFLISPSLSARDSSILLVPEAFVSVQRDARRTLLLPVFVQGRTTSSSTSNLQGRVGSQRDYIFLAWSRLFVTSFLPCFLILFPSLTGNLARPYLHLLWTRNVFQFLCSRARRSRFASRSRFARHPPFIHESPRNEGDSPRFGVFVRSPTDFRFWPRKGGGNFGCKVSRRFFAHVPASYHPGLVSWERTCAPTFEKRTRQTRMFFSLK